MTSAPSQLLETALAAHRAGLCVLPPKEDGTKAPDSANWAEFKTRRPTETEVRSSYAIGRTGLGIVCGATSGGVELFDFDCGEIWCEYQRRAEDVGLSSLLARVEDGYLERTPNGGVHLLYYCPAPRNGKLARRPTRPGEQNDPSDRIKTLIETKGEGGYAVTAPSYGRVHPSGKPYELLRGGFGSIARITAEERDELHGLARTFDETPRLPHEEPRSYARKSNGELRPGDDFNARATWREVLEPRGWVPVFERGSESYWRRPGKPAGISATTNYAGSDLFYVFTSSTEFEPERGYSKFSAFALLNHGGDFEAAARELGRRGFGAPLQAPGSVTGEEQSPEPDAAPPDAGPLPAIQLVDRQLDAVVDDAVAALVRANDPPVIYQRGGVLVQIRQDGSGGFVIAEMGDAAIVEQASRAGLWFKKDRATGPTRELAGIIVARLMRSLDLLPSLAGITQSPLLRADGQLVERAGYDRVSGFYYAPPVGFQLGHVPQHPSADEVAAAIKLLGDAIKDFPFAADADRAAALAALVTISIRELIPGCVPATLIDAPAPGTGKGLLADEMTVIATGSTGAKMAESDGRSDDEMRKRITALLLEGRAVVHLDNVERPLQSASLAAVLTTEVWSDRLLGRNQSVTLPNRAVWLVTGNNLRLRGDLPRRCVWCRLDAKLAQPWTREGFTHDDLLGWVRAHRGDLLAAVFTLARAWIRAGRPGPAAGVPPLGGYESWRAVVGGILGVAGVPGFLGNLAALYDAADDDVSAWAGFLLAWRDRFPSQPIPVSALLVELTSTGSPLAEEMPLEMAELVEKASTAKVTKASAAKRIGKMLGRKVDTRYTVGDESKTLRIVREPDSHSKAMRWGVAE